MPTFFIFSPLWPMMMPFCESRSTYITAMMCMEFSFSSNFSTMTSTE